MKSITTVFGIISLATIISCGGTSEQKEDAQSAESQIVIEEVETVTETPADVMADKGIGPVTSVTLEEVINTEMADAGKELYNQMCSACHKPDVNFIGPAPKGILDRRSPEWVMNMIINPQEMLEKNETAKALLEEYNNVPMTDMGLNEEQVRSILEYFRTL